MRNAFKGRLLRGSAVLAFTALAAGSAFAQDETTDDEIFVTATKRQQTIQSVPFSINAQTQDDIQKTGTTNLEDLSRNVAGLAIQNLGPGQSQVGIRGVSAGQIVRDQPGVKEQVGIYLDESVISLSLFTPDLDLFDLDRVETLRGPQGTLFGSGSIGGTIRYITNQPNVDDAEAMFEGNLNVVEDGGLGGGGKGMVNLPIGDSMALRVVGYYTEYSGFIDALLEGGGRKEDVNGGRRWGGRASLRMEPWENVAFTPRFVYQKVETAGFNRQEVYNLYANPFTTTRPAVTFGEREQFLLLEEGFDDDFLMADATLEIDIGPVQFISITSYTNRDILVSRDASALTHSVSIDLAFNPSAFFLPSNLQDTTHLEQFTQEARLTSDYESALQWVAGFFYANTDRNYAQRLPTPGYDAFTDMRFGAGTAAAVANGYGPDSPYNADLPYDIEQAAIFAEATLDLTNRFHVTAGARYYDFEETRSFISGGLFSNGDNRTDRTESNGVSPRFLISWDASDALTFNAQASEGFRLGGVNDPLNIPLCTPGDVAIFGAFQDYDDETLWNYEAGAKLRTSGVTFNVAGFYTDISNLQVTLDAGSCSSRITFNVPEAHTLGAEFEFEAELFDGFEVAFGGTVLEAEFDSTIVDGMGAVVAGLREGNRLASVPELQLSAAATYSFDLGPDTTGYIAASVQHMGTRFTQPSDQENNPRSFVSGLPFGGATGAEATVLDLELDSYQILNVNAGISKGDWDFIFYANNLTDENAQLAFDRERGGRARLGFHTNQPRTFGVTARVRF